MNDRPLPLPPPEAVVFDLDGTLVDTVPTRIEAWFTTLSDAGLSTTRDQLARLIGIDGKRLVREVAAASGNALPEARVEEIDRLCGELFERLNRSPWPLPGAATVLAALDERAIPWAIATSSRRQQVGTSVAALRLRRQPTIVDGSSVEHAKPEPDLLLEAARVLAVPIQGTWYVGDSTWDMVAALAAGMVPIAAMAGAALNDAALEEAGAALVVDTLEGLVARLPPAGGSDLPRRRRSGVSA